MTKFSTKTLSVAIGALLLSACAGVPKQTYLTPTAVGEVSAEQAQIAQNANNTKNEHAKDKLADALKAQLRTSFGYRTDVYVSNQIRREALANATSEQLASHDDVNEKCNIEHDEAYVAFLKTVKADEGDIEDDKYSEQKSNIKKDFLACQERASSEDNIFAWGKDHKAWQSGETLKRLVQASIDHEDMAETTSTYDSDHTALDAKKAQLVHEYLIKPTHIAMVGNYEPFKGVITALPSVAYHAKNAKFDLNQPMYVDLNAGGIYLWADNFALANSQALDKTLGDKWQDKWLFLPINDGSLPENFTKDFIKAVKDAQKERFLALPAQSFGVGVASLPFVDNLPSDKQALMSSTPHVISLNATAKERAYADYVFKDTLYHHITSAYPELSSEQTSAPEYEIADGESVIYVKNTETSPVETETSPSLNSRFLMTVMLGKLSEDVAVYQDELASDISDDVSPSKASKYAPVSHYGIRGGKIAWLHQRHYQSSPKASYDEPILVDVFTQILPNQAVNFDKLPTHLQKPTAENTVNLFDYKDELQKALENSDDKYLGILSKLLFGQSEVQAEEAEAGKEE